jgi:hypothetical protein
LRLLVSLFSPVSPAQAFFVSTTRNPAILPGCSLRSERPPPHSRPTNPPTPDLDLDSQSGSSEAGVVCCQSTRVKFPTGNRVISTTSPPISRPQRLAVIYMISIGQ